MIRIRKNVPLKPISTFKIGGRGRYFCEIKNDSELAEAIVKAKELGLPYRIIAGGSNVVFPDKLLNCLLVKIKSDKLKFLDGEIIVDAGVSLSRVITAANNRGLRGLETLAGIPGTISGAIVGNAGAYGQSISSAVERVEIFFDDQKRWLTNRECDFSYRESVFKNNPYIVLRAVLKLKKGSSKNLKKISRDIIKNRLKKYKPGLKCPGSFFKNILVNKISKESLALVDKNKIIDGKIPAGYLLEEVGAKGMRLGGIKIADFHANLFLNTGKAKAGDVKKLANILKKRVQKKFRISLEEEVRYF